jgi:signal transduction histidine kinase
VGFEVDVAKRGAGLGLVSMQERVHVLHGKLRVESRLGAGTTVLASVPLIAAKERSPGAVEDWRVAV